MKLKLERGEIPPAAMKYILQALASINFGEVALIAQDGLLVQIEREEKVRLENLLTPSQAAPQPLANPESLARHIRQEFVHLLYGRLVIVVKQGKVTQLERTEKQRFVGLDGEGI